MSEVHRYSVVKMLSEAGNKISYDPHGPEVVMAKDYDALAAEAQALREEVAQQKFLTKVENDALKMMTDKANELKSEVEQLEEELESLRARVVVAPERKLLNAGVPGLNRNSGWNACLDELARLNGKTVSEGLLREVARHLGNWLELHECECDGGFHYCGRDQVAKTNRELRALLNQDKENGNG
ncbi:TPA: hypothetical protein NOE04_006530 [Pseudomonas aeruginosa]|nr:hypothetical protein [Pseudomonas aeruginosa]MDU3622692.1 hypothetical protein [Pseudomonas aeruginosa]MDU3699585.1 hypothetical protein [Pseudomonas aeruginosa]HCI1689743.1 hypothetical protein [Pseudomonas aeruginosa]